MTNSQDINNRLKKVLEEMPRINKNDETNSVAIEKNKLSSSNLKYAKRGTNTDK
jgi:Holliday junction resolvasome RuvABC endonuclease subunit